MILAAGYLAVAILQIVAGDNSKPDELKSEPFGSAKQLIEFCASDDQIRYLQCKMEVNLLALGLFAGGQSKDGCGAFDDADKWEHLALPTLAKWIGSHREFETKTEMAAFEAGLNALYPCQKIRKD
jgi:hypothetical protein